MHLNPIYTEFFYRLKIFQMLILVFLSFLQILFLPGLLFTLRLKKISSLDRMLISVPLSLVINYSAVMLLYSIGFYTRSVLFILVVLELIFISIAFHNRRLLEGMPDFPALKIRLENVIPFLIFFIFYKSSFFSVFTDWDAVVSWNRWALELMGGDFHGSRNYPLGIPSLYSILYVLCGSDNLQTFSKMIPALWVFVGIIVFLRASTIWQKYNVELTLASSIWLLLISKAGMGASIIFSGYVDSFMAVYGIFYIYFLAHIHRMVTHKNVDLDKVKIYLIVLASSALVKFTGIFIFFSFLLFLLSTLGFRNVTRNCWLTILLSLVLLFHWYLFNTLYYADWHEQARAYGVGLDPNYISRFFQAVTFFVKSLSIPLFLISVYAVYRSRQLVFIAAILVLPILFFWALLVSYDLRATFVIFPFLAFLISVGILEFLPKCFNQIQPLIKLEYKTKFVNFAECQIALSSKFIALCLMSSLLFFSGCYLAFNHSGKVDNLVYSSNTEQRLKANDFGANYKLYELLEHDRKAKILSCWQMIYGLPNSNGRVLPMGDCSMNIVDRWLNDKSINYFLYWDAGGQDTPKIQEVRRYILSKDNDVSEETLMPGYVLFSRNINE